MPDIIDETILTEKPVGNGLYWFKPRNPNKPKSHVVSIYYDSTEKERYIEFIQTFANPIPLDHLEDGWFVKIIPPHFFNQEG
jgi:hypothetical protein